MQIGVQVFGISKWLKADARGLLEKLKELGYGMVEPCVAIGEMGRMNELIWSAQDLRDNIGLIRELGFAVPSFHALTPNYAEAAQEIAGLVKATGARYVVVPCTPEANEQKAQEMAQLNAQLEKVGAELLLHCSFTDCANKVGEKTVYEWMCEKSGAGMQVDVGWALYGGVDPLELMRRNAKRVKSLHYKDISAKMGEIKPVESNVALGRGILDARGCYDFGVEMDIPHIIDQDASQGDIFADLGEAVQLLEGYAKNGII